MYEIETEDILKAQNKSEEAMSKIIEKNSGLIWSIVNRFTNRGHSKEDLYQIGCIGLIKAVQRFDLKFNVKITTYSVPYIIGEIKRFIRDDGPIKVSRSVKELSYKINELQRQEINNTGTELSIIELSNRLKVDKEEIVFALEASRKLESIDEEIYDDSQGETKSSRITVKKDETNNIVDKICIKQLIEKLDTREKQIIILRYYKDKTQTEVAKMLGITQVQVSRIESKVLKEMKKK